MNFLGKEEPSSLEKKGRDVKEGFAGGEAGAACKEQAFSEGNWSKKNLIITA